MCVPLYARKSGTSAFVLFRAQESPSPIPKISARVVRVCEREVLSRSESAVCVFVLHELMLFHSPLFGGERVTKRNAGACRYLPRRTPYTEQSRMLRICFPEKCTEFLVKQWPKEQRGREIMSTESICLQYTMCNCSDSN